MRMLLLPMILTLSACASAALPGATEGKTYFNYPRHCEACEKNGSNLSSGGYRPGSGTP